jgi:hypothetical protein
MLDCERWTLTHSSGWADVPVELELALVVGLAPALALWLGLAARRAASEAEAVAEAEVWDDDGEADGEPDDPVGDADAGALLGFVLAGGELGAPETVEDGVGVGDFDGFGVGVGVGVGEGEGVLEAGSSWQLVSVFAFALVEVPALGEAAASRNELACAVPGRPASTPRVRKPPPSTLSAVTRMCARRMRIARSPLLIRG